MNDNEDKGDNNMQVTIKPTLSHGLEVYLVYVGSTLMSQHLSLNGANYKASLYRKALSTKLINK